LSAGIPAAGSSFSQRFATALRNLAFIAVSARVLLGCRAISALQRVHSQYLWESWIE
jgi:hypothetical protein